ncbi:MAG: VOC family protein [Pseudomonadota bacterium]
MGALNGLHHLAISTGDMKTQIAFFTDVLGMELVGLYWMHGVEGAWHGFLRLNESSAVAFVYSDKIRDTAPQKNVTFAGNPGDPSAPGTLQHLALNVDTMDALMTMRDRIRSRGVPVFGPIHHGFCSSIYFAGPENLALEVATSHKVEHPLDANTWIDPDVQALAGISDEELAGYVAPSTYEGEGGSRPQPAYDPSKPHQHYPEAQYQMMLQAPDEVITQMGSFPDPPAKPA